MLNTRSMQVEDIDVVVSLCKDFFYSSKMGVVGEFDPEVVKNTLLSLINSDSFFGEVALDGDQVIGFITALASVSLFSKGTICYEQVWYIKDEYRGTTVGLKLLYLMERWAKNVGCSYIQMGSAAEYSNVDRVYEKLRYVKVNSNFMKRI